MKLIKPVLFLSLILTFNAAAQEMMMHQDPVETYTSLKDAQRQAKKGPVVLFFHATWCPTCKEAMMDLVTRKSDLGDVTVVIVDYDKYKSEKRKYGITYQHTFVQIDEKGKVLAQWSGGGVDEILSHVVHEEMM